VLETAPPEPSSQFLRVFSGLPVATKKLGLVSDVGMSSFSNHWKSDCRGRRGQPTTLIIGGSASYAYADARETRTHADTQESPQPISEDTSGTNLEVEKLLSIDRTGSLTSFPLLFPFLFVSLLF